MAKRVLPARIRDKAGNSVIDAQAYLRLAVEVLEDVDIDGLTEDGKVGYAQALALVALTSRAKHLQDLPDIANATSVLLR